MKKNKLDSIPRFAWAQAAVGLAAILSLFFWLQFSRSGICCSDFDGYYDIHWSQLLWEGIRHGHFPSAFSWLPLTSLNAHEYSDQHLLFHLLLIPFLWFSTPVSAAKISAVLFGTVATFSSFWLLLHYRIRYPMLWLLALLGSSSLFLYRMNMTRAQSVSVILIMAGIFLLFEEQYRWLAALAFLYVWTYNLFVILVAMALIWTVAIWWTNGRREWRPVLWTAIGTGAGFIVNPYFPNNLRLFREHLTAKAGELSLQPGTGTEWYALRSWDLLTSGLVAFAAMFVGYIAFGFLLGRRGRGGLHRVAFLLLFASLLLLLTARSGRFNEYWPPSAVLFAAFTLQAVWQLHSPDVHQEKRIMLGNPGAKWEPKKLQAIVVGIALVCVCFYQVRQAQHWIATPANPDQYRAGAQWLREHTPRGSVIFNASWDDFPKLFYYNDANAYVSGLDPIYLADHNADLGRLYERIVTGKERDPGNYIRQKFGADYVFVTPASDRNFYVAAMLSGQFTKVYEDQDCVVLRVRDSDYTDSE